MSANNYIRIRKRPDNRYEITMRDMESDSMYEAIKWAEKSLEKSLELAEEYIGNNEVEYGIRYKDRKVLGEEYEEERI